MDNQRGLIRGVPAVMGNYYGKSLGVIDLALAYQDGHWQVQRDATHAEVRQIKNPDGTSVAADEDMEHLVRDEDAGTIAYVKTPIGRSDYPVNTYFVAAGETSALQLVNMAQRDYVEKYIKSNLPQYASLPVLSSMSPLKAGFGGPKDYTDIAPGPLAINNAADLYLYPNTLTAVKLSGAGVKAWLEKSAGWFDRIDPGKREPQELINLRFPTYNFDVLQGDLAYAIDVTKPDGQRIADLRYHGKFIVVTNNYRASGGGRFPGLDGSNVVISTTDANRDVLIQYVKAQGELTRARHGTDRNWHFVKVKTAGPVVFTSAAGKLELAQAAGLDNVTLVKDKGDGSAIYAIDLSK
ncbi:MAG: hypothetical protein E6K53_17260 [Gammaproteobacteria bacterium]|nr:MAG: hypothetical protein E6K53_17260 [Gammaproteobacteria bacterium]